MRPPRLDVALRVDIPYPSRGAPSGLAEPVPRVPWHGLLRGLRLSGLRSSFMLSVWRASAVDN